MKQIKWPLLLFLLWTLLGCSERILSQSSGGVHTFFFDEDSTSISFDIRFDDNQVITVTNLYDNLPIGVYMEGLDHDDQIVFRDNFIRPGRSSATSSLVYLDPGQEIWISIVVYDSYFVGLSEAAIALISSFIGDWADFRDWLREAFGDNWLHHDNSYFIILE